MRFEKAAGVVQVVVGKEGEAQFDGKLMIEEAGGKIVFQPELQIGSLQSPRCKVFGKIADLVVAGKEVEIAEADPGCSAQSNMIQKLVKSMPVDRLGCQP